MRPIPPKMRQKLEKLPRMQHCTLAPLSGLYGPCMGHNTASTGRLEWHHVWIYAGTQINEPWAILSACHTHHELVKKDMAVRDAFERISLLLATDEDLKKYPRRDWKQDKKRLGITWLQKKSHSGTK